MSRRWHACGVGEDIADTQLDRFDAMQAAIESEFAAHRDKLEPSDASRG